MQRNVLDFALKNYDCMPGGSREACILANEFLRNSCVGNNGIRKIASSGVDSEEFLQAVRTLIAYAFPKDDEIPTMWHCEQDCHYVGAIVCRGECQAIKGAENECPYYSDDGNW